MCQFWHRAACKRQRSNVVTVHEDSQRVLPPLELKQLPCGCGRPRWLWPNWKTKSPLQQPPHSPAPQIVGPRRLDSGSQLKIQSEIVQVLDPASRDNLLYQTRIRHAEWKKSGPDARSGLHPSLFFPVRRNLQLCFLQRFCKASIEKDLFFSSSSRCLFSFSSLGAVFCRHSCTRVSMSTWRLAFFASRPCAMCRKMAGYQAI